MRPSDGEKVMIVADGKVASQDDYGHSMKEVGPYLLQNGKLAYEPTFSQWICKHGDAETFFLENQEGRGLETWLTDLPERQEWTIKNGYVATASEPTRYLLSDSIKGFGLMVAEDFESGGVTPVLLMPCAESACFEVLDSGLKMLKGGWSALALADIQWDGADALDLTEISLPVNIQPFLHLPPKNNHLIYVSEEGSEIVSPIWKNVVVCRTDGQNRLLGNLRLEDRCDFQLHRPVICDAGQVYYERSVYADLGWETLCLPFDAEIPENFVGEEFCGVSDGGTLLFKSTRNVHANVPLIIKSLHYRPDGATVDLRLSSKGMTLLPKKDKETDFFFGTYHSITVGDGEIYYFLDQRGTSFVKAAKSSHLSPFRGYVRAEHQMAVKHIDMPTGCDQTISDRMVDQRPNGIYTLDGRHLSRDIVNVKSLPSGVYIINGKKYLK